jgi:hypothetical protein
LFELLKGSGLFNIEGMLLFSVLGGILKVITLVLKGWICFILEKIK